MCISEGKMDWRSWLRKKFQVRSQLLRGCMAEFLAVFVLMVFTEGCSASAIFTHRRNDLLFAAFGSGLAVTMAVYVAGGVTGAFLNPAIAVAFSVLGKLPWKNCFCYMIAQYLGAFLASLAIYAQYYDALNIFDGGHRQVLGDNGTAQIWSTYPQAFLSPQGAFVDQVFGTALLIIVVLSMVDKKNWKPQNGYFPIAIGLLIVVLDISLAYNAGAALNPSRDLAPRLFTYVAGYGTETFSVKGYTWFFVPVVGSHAGAIVGAVIYQLFIGAQWPQDDLDDSNSVSSMSIHEKNFSLAKRKNTRNFNLDITRDFKERNGISTVLY
uniref:Aquaporin-2 n=1 Tax=Milnesium tardigradum TaxID=46460 RepID=AQP2_MILTA|nr:RecName: Full=Aquaporin-2; Short=AQP-2 [Milnesium tardigradum]AEP14556.2 aquaporin 2 [Milnesium tardigradum]